MEVIERRDEHLLAALARWEETAKVTSKLAVEAEKRELALAAALQDARDMLAECGWPVEDLAHLDATLAAYRVPA